MSIPLVIQTYDEVRRLAIAGSVVAGGDFRLKKFVDPLKKSAEMAPIFGKVADAIEKLIIAPDKDSAPALLELGTLVNAILYTQGETGAAGEMTELLSANLGVQTSSQASARVLKPLMEALTTTGSGRLEIITEAHKRSAFCDLRLVNYALRGLDDVYSDIAQFIAREVLPIYGKAIIPELRAAMKFPGKNGDARRLKVLYRLDREGARDLIEQALEDGSKELKIAALECLGDSKKDLPHLLDQASAKAKDVRAAALTGLGRVHDDASVLDVFKKALSGNDLEIAACPASRNKNPKLLSMLIEDARSQFECLFTTKDKDKLKKQLERFNLFLRVFSSRSDKETDAFLLDCFNKRDQIQTLKGDAVSGSDVNQTLAMMMASSKSSKLHESLAVKASELSPDMFQYGFLAAARVKKSADLFDIFSPLLKVAGPARGKKKDDASLKAQSLSNLLQQIAAHRSRMPNNIHFGYSHFDFDETDEDQSEWIKRCDLDPRWLDAAVDAGDAELVCALARPGHKGAVEFLGAAVKAKLDEKKAEAHDFFDLIKAMIRIGHTRATDCWIAVVQKIAARKTSYYGTYGFSHLVEAMPLDAAAKIEAILPSLPERLIDEILPHLQVLKEKAR